MSKPQKLIVNVEQQHQMGADRLARQTRRRQMWCFKAASAFRFKCGSIGCRSANPEDVDCLPCNQLCCPVVLQAAAATHRSALTVVAPSYQICSRCCSISCHRNKKVIAFGCHSAKKTSQCLPDGSLPLREKPIANYRVQFAIARRYLPTVTNLPPHHSLVCRTASSAPSASRRFACNRF